MPESEDLPVYNARKTPRNRECAKAATKCSLLEMLSEENSDIMCANKTAIRYITSFLWNAHAGPASSICVRSKTRKHLIEQVGCFFVCSVFSEPDEHGRAQGVEETEREEDRTKSDCEAAIRLQAGIMNICVDFTGR